MSRPHKYADSHIRVDTQVTGDRFAEITKFVGDNTKIFGVAGVRFEGAEPGQTNFSVRSMAGFYELITFHVAITDTLLGSTGQSCIDSYKTTQQKYLFVPISPRTMNGYSVYRKFMNSLAEAIIAEDTHARISISEQGV